MNGRIDKVRNGDIEIVHRFAGAADGPVVLVTHAMGTSHRIWDPQVPALAKRFRLLLYDRRRPGAGRGGVSSRRSRAMT